MVGDLMKAIRSTFGILEQRDRDRQLPAKISEKWRKKKKREGSYL
jgi:hypothetical protein